MGLEPVGISELDVTSTLGGTGTSITRTVTEDNTDITHPAPEISIEDPSGTQQYSGTIDSNTTFEASTNSEYRNKITDSGVDQSKYGGVSLDDLDGPWEDVVYLKYDIRIESYWYYHDAEAYVQIADSDGVVQAEDEERDVEDSTAVAHISGEMPIDGIGYISSAAYDRMDQCTWDLTGYLEEAEVVQIQEK